MPDQPLVFLGTPSAAAEVLESLIVDGRDIVHVITGESKRRGRGSAMSPTPVQVVAERHGISFSHGLGWFDGDHHENLRGIVVAYGRLIPGALLRRVPMWNVHFSLLPRWRGAAPVARAILAGDQVTGVCIMEMDEGLDTGNVVSCAELPIRDDDTTETLTSRLTQVGAELLRAALNGPRPVAHAQVGEPVYAKKIAADETRIDWTRGVLDVSRRVRAVRAHSMMDGRRVRILEVVPSTCQNHDGLEAGRLFDDGCVGAVDGLVRLVRVQPEGRIALRAGDWLRGLRGDISRFDGHE